MSSWKTTLSGVLTIFAAAIAFLILPALHDQPMNWTAFLAAATPGIGLLFSRDNDKSSEDVGIK